MSATSSQVSCCGLSFSCPKFCLPGAIALGVVGLLALRRLCCSSVGRPAITKGDGRVVVVTGCDTGFGRAVATRLHAMGFVVVAGCMTPSAVAELKAAGLEHARICDVTSEADVATMFAAAVAAGGVRGVYGLVNNAGISLGSHIEVTPISDIEKVMAVNFTGVARCSAAALPSLKVAAVAEQARGGPKPRVVTITSLSALEPIPGMAAYTASKHAARAYSDCLRWEAGAFGIGVTQIEPAFHATPIVTSGIAHSDKLWEAAAQRAGPAGLPAKSRALRGATSESQTRFATTAARDPKHVVDAVVGSLLAAHPRAHVRVVDFPTEVFVCFRHAFPSLFDRLIFFNYRRLTRAAVRAGAPFE